HEKIASERDFEKAKAGRDTARAESHNAALNLQREERLFANGAEIRREYDVAKSETKRQLQHMDTLKQRLVFLGLPEQMVEKVIDSEKIQVLVPLVAPAAGTITAIHVAPGKVVSPEKAAFRITNLSTMIVQADLPEANLAHVKQGTPVKVK